MAIVFHSPQRAIDLAVQQLKSDGLVHPDAVFNLAAPEGLRSEIAYRDLDFTQRLGRTAVEEEVVDAALHFSKARGIVKTSASYDKGAFENLRQEIAASFMLGVD